MNLLDAVIGLPANLFYGTGIPACILVFRKDRTDDKVLFIDASGEGNYKKGKNQNILRDEDIKRIVDTYQAKETVDKYSYLASRDEIKENDYNLNIPRYVDTFEEEELVDIDEVKQNIAAIEAELAKVQAQLDRLLELDKQTCDLVRQISALREKAKGKIKNGQDDGDEYRQAKELYNKRIGISKECKSIFNKKEDDTDKYYYVLACLNSFICSFINTL